ncbi:VacJ family lipoprotein [Rhodobacter lacus]|uniref:VacJ family lipoprotein n=1 Tax=Rhodobacter lacus TaxID=1641972 RepID=A0ABW5ABL8_9RHOB
MRKIFGLCLIASITLAACGGGTTSAGPSTPGGINDPYEGTNRHIHAFNKGVDRALFKAREGEPRSVDNAVYRGFSNASSNLSLPGKVVNSLLQGRPAPAAKNTFRFVINTTIGIGGIFDPAGHALALPETDTDFGETLAVWGVGEGAYVELPILGPSTARDAVGRVVDMAFDPLGNVFDSREASAAAAVTVGGKVAERKQHGDIIESVLYDSADSYAQERLLYLQMRRHQVGAKETNDEEAWDPYADPYGEPDAQ